MRLRSFVKRDWQVEREVKSAGTEWVLTLFGFGGMGGAAMSVRVREVTAGSSRREVARACPTKPPAPVMMQLIFGSESIVVCRCRNIVSGRRKGVYAMRLGGCDAVAAPRRILGPGPRG